MQGYFRISECRRRSPNCVIVSSPFIAARAHSATYDSIEHVQTRPRAGGASARTHTYCVFYKDMDIKREFYLMKLPSSAISAVGTAEKAPFNATSLGQTRPYLTVNIRRYICARPFINTGRRSYEGLCHTAVPPYRRKCVCRYA